MPVVLASGNYGREQLENTERPIKNEQSREAEHKTQEEDKQNKTKIFSIQSFFIYVNY